MLDLLLERDLLPNSSSVTFCNRNKEADIRRNSKEQYGTIRMVPLKQRCFAF